MASAHVVLTSSGHKFEVTAETAGRIAEAMTARDSRTIAFQTNANRKKVTLAVSHIVAIEFEE